MGEEGLKKAYRKAVLKYHPDKTGVQDGEEDEVGCGFGCLKTFKGRGVRSQFYAGSPFLATRTFICSRGPWHLCGRVVSYFYTPLENEGREELGVSAWRTQGGTACWSVRSRGKSVNVTVVVLAALYSTVLFTLSSGSLAATCLFLVLLPAR